MSVPADPSPLADRVLLAAGHAGERVAWVDRVAFALILAIALAGAAAALAAYLDQPDLLWRDLFYFHDRNGHFQFGLDLALAVKTADPVWFFSELDKAKVWPPLHGLVLSAILLVAGTDY